MNTSCREDVSTRSHGVETPANIRLFAREPAGICPNDIADLSAAHGFAYPLVRGVKSQMESDVQFYIGSRTRFDHVDSVFERQRHWFFDQYTLCRRGTTHGLL